MIKAVIFDLDGVIVDTAKYHYQSWYRLAKSLGFELTEDQNHMLKGVSRMESLDIILEIGGVEKSKEEKQELAALKNKWYREYITHLDRSEILPGIEVLLDDLKENNIKIALGSASKNSMTILNGLNLTSYFNVIIDGNKTTTSKPHPEVFLMGAEALELNPNECLVIEDSIKGLEAANTGGFFSIGVGDDKGLSIADAVVSSMDGMTYSALLELLEK
jgi:beta-phosphoglucomutase